MWLNLGDFPLPHVQCLADLLNNGISTISGGILRFSFSFLHSFERFCFSSFVFGGKKTFLVTGCKSKAQVKPIPIMGYWSPYTWGTGIRPLQMYINWVSAKEGQSRVSLPNLHILCFPIHLPAVAFIQLHKVSHTNSKILHIIFVAVVCSQISRLTQVAAQMFAARGSKVMRTDSLELRKERERVRLSISVEACVLVGLKRLQEHRTQKQFPFGTMVNLSCFLQIWCHHHVPQHASLCIRDWMSEQRNHVSRWDVSMSYK